MTHVLYKIKTLLMQLQNGDRKKRLISANVPPAAKTHSAWMRCARETVCAPIKLTKFVVSVVALQCNQHAHTHTHTATVYSTRSRHQSVTLPDFCN